MFSQDSTNIINDPSAPSPLGVNEIRDLYLHFFETKGHKILPSFPLVPHHDKSILLINAGMTPMKPWFTGAETPPSKRVTTCQKCIRTNDIDSVGITDRHGTFFEMLGNFSFGDYFKAEVIPWAFEFLTRVLHLDPKRLYVTVYLDDDEAEKLWIQVGLDPNHIARLGKEDNFWEHGTGPCGPCTEIFYDRGESYACGKNCHFPCECDRFIEIWNLVFSQFERTEEGEYLPLKQKNIDTGAGLERMAVALQGVKSLFEVDTVRKVLDTVVALSGKAYGQDPNNDRAIRVITDHIRSSVFMIADGIIPSNEGRGYVLRRLLRRSVRFGQLLGIQEKFLEKIAAVTIDVAEGSYPELEARREKIMAQIHSEETSFRKTLDQGLGLLTEAIAALKDKGESVVPGDILFKLHDTFGFPLDLSREVAGEQGLSVDLEGFQILMAAQKERARKAQLEKQGSSWKGLGLPPVTGIPKTEFTGYEKMQDEGKLLNIFLLAPGTGSEETSWQKLDSLDEESYLKTGEGVLFLVFDKTPAYGEGGGQVGDQGTISFPNARLDLVDTKKVDNVYLHRAILQDGSLQVGEQGEVVLTQKKRVATMRNHSATHLLHAALKEVLGSHVDQQGSMVNDEYLRFDFSFPRAMTEEELQATEDLVNAQILAGSPIHTDILPLEEAKKTGAEALFTEKYGDLVRVVSMGNFSKEFCGGTHLANTAEVGYFRIQSESSIAAGIRRIEAVTGQAAIELAKIEKQIIHGLTQSLQASSGDLVERVALLQDEVKNLKKDLADQEEKQLLAQAQTIADQACKKVSVPESKGLALAELPYLCVVMPGVTSKNIRVIGDYLRDRIQGAVLLGATEAGKKEGEVKISFFATGTPEAVQAGFHAGKLVQAAASLCGGKGGGKANSAQAGAKDPSKLPEALTQAETLLQKSVSE